MQTDLTGDQLFASGLTVTNDGCQCPAAAAGEIDDLVTGTDIEPVITKYDEIVRNSDIERPEGKVAHYLDEEQARNAWLSAVGYVRKLDDGDSAAVEAGERVARELGWLGE